MTRWQILLDTAPACILPIISVVLLVCIAGLIRELTRREHREGD